MRRILLTASVGILTFIVGTSSSSFWRSRYQQPADDRLPPLFEQSRLLPGGWQKIEANRFSFYLPWDMRLSEAVGDGGGLGKHLNNGKLIVNYSVLKRGSYVGNNLTCKQLLSPVAGQFHDAVAEVIVGRRKAIQSGRTAPFSKFVFTTLCFPDLGEGDLLLFEVADQQRESTLVQQIVNSLEFR